jgi:hypothetical protein
MTERQETRANFLKKDKDRLCKRLEDLEERLYSTKMTLQSLLPQSPKSISEYEKSIILDYLIEEKNIFTRRLSEISVLNTESLQKSSIQKKKIKEILEREKTIESELNSKLLTVLQESREKEENIVKLSLLSEKLNSEFKELAKNRLNSVVSPKNVPDLLVKNQAGIERVILKVRDFTKNIKEENKDLEKKIERYFKELDKCNQGLKYPVKVGKTLDELLDPVKKDLREADIRYKCEEVNFRFNKTFKRQEDSKSQTLRLKLEEEFIKLETLCKELKNAQTTNSMLQEDKLNLLSVLSHIRKGTKQVTHKPKVQDSFNNLHKRVVSNPLEYKSQDPVLQKEENPIKFDLDSKDLDQFSSVEDNNYDIPCDSMIDDFIDL